MIYVLCRLCKFSIVKAWSRTIFVLLSQRFDAATLTVSQVSGCKHACNATCQSLCKSNKLETAVRTQQPSNDLLMIRFTLLHYTRQTDVSDQVTRAANHCEFPESMHQQRPTRSTSSTQKTFHNNGSWLKLWCAVFCCPVTCTGNSHTTRYHHFRRLRLMQCLS